MKDGLFRQSQIVYHVAGDGDAWSKPFWRAITTFGATINRNEFAGTGTWVDTLTSNKRPVQNALGIIQAHRRLLAELSESLPDAWEQHVTFLDSQGQETNKTSAGQILNMLAEHMGEHIATIEAIRKNTTFDCP